MSIFLDRTPFYAESGGQVGDTGVITHRHRHAPRSLDTTYGAARASTATTPRIVEGTIEPGQEATAAIDVERRDAIRRNHTGTHVLHWALRKVLGENVKQQGSLVDPDRLRFDFGPSDAAHRRRRSRRSKTSPTREILANDPVRHYETTKAEAANLGAIAFFGDKYGDIVRVLEAGRHSIELCGGTHVRALGDIGPVKIVSEASIGANLRRIEAVTGTGPIERLREEERRLAELAEVLNVPVGEVVDGARKRLDEIKALRDEIKALKRQAAGGQAVDAGGQGGRRRDRRARRRPRARHPPRHRPGRCATRTASAPSCWPPRPRAAARRWSRRSRPTAASTRRTLLEEAKKLIKGGGGKDPLLAVAGGKDADGIDAALDSVRAAAGIDGS